MYQKINFMEKSKLSSASNTIKFGENFEFTVTLRNENKKLYQIDKIEGNFEITKIVAIIFKDYHPIFSYFFGRYTTSTFVNILPNNTFLALDGDVTYTFFTSANINLKEFHAATQSIYISTHRLNLLKFCQFFKEYLFLIDCDKPLVYYVKKIGTDPITGYDTEIHIENPYDIEINGKKGDYKIQKSSTSAINLSLSFVYDPATVNMQISNATKRNLATKISNDPAHINILDSSRPQSSLSTDTKFFKIFSNEKLADTFLMASDHIKIPAHRCILATFSKHFEDIFHRDMAYPATINVNNFDAATITAAIEFIYGKNDAIIGKEMHVFNFALEYKIQDITDACCSFFEESVNPSNVCEYIQFAYSNNFEELKQKCLKVLVEKKKEIDPTKFAKLLENVLFDFARF